MNIVRTVKSKDFTVLSNKIFRNKGLSLRARGLLCTVLSFSAEWDLNISGLAKFIGCGKTQIKTALDEIIEAGYLIKVGQIRKAGKFNGYEWILVDDPDKFNGSKSNENRQKMDDFPLRKIGYGESGSKSNENRQKMDDLPLRKNRCGKTAAENRTQININHQVSTNKYQSIINPDDIDDFINEVWDEYSIKIKQNDVAKLLEVNEDLNYWLEAIANVDAYTKKSKNKIKNLVNYLIGYSQKNQVPIAFEHNSKFDASKSEEQLKQIRAIAYANLESAPDSFFSKLHKEYAEKT